MNARRAGARHVAVPRTPDFADDVDFLTRHADAIVLRGEGCGPIVVSRTLSGRVMTSAFSDAERGFGLVNRQAILPRAPGEPQPAFANYGGEDRLWITPEGGPWALFFEPGSEQLAEHWFVPRAVDGGPRSLARRDERSVGFRDLTLVSNIAGTRFPLELERRIDALSRTDIAALLAGACAPGLLPASVSCVAFRSTNRMRWSGQPPAGVGEGEGGEVGLWILGQFVPGDGTRVFLPFRGPLAPRDLDPLGAIKRDYFGTVPDARLALRPACGSGGAGDPGGAMDTEIDGVTGVAHFTADSRLRSKLGVSRAGATGWIGAWDDERGVLTLVQHTLPAPGAIVPDCDWKPDNPQPGRGDVAASYNDGGEPRFFELESLSAALPRAPGASVEHVSTTIHLGGDRKALSPIARAVLHTEP